MGADKRIIKRHRGNAQLRKHRLVKRYRAVKAGKLVVPDRDAELSRLKEKLVKRNYPVENL